jgi:2-polyprenyl-6-methoxyphenol hydroxylase-like FAD-dependent oxidoreductase
MDVALVGGGICGLSLALNLKERAIDCRIYERAPEIKPLGVCITLRPHAMRESCALGLNPAIWPTSFRFPYEAARTGCQSGAHQPRAVAGFHQHQGRGAGR